MTTRGIRDCSLRHSGCAADVERRRPTASHALTSERCEDGHRTRRPFRFQVLRQVDCQDLADEAVTLLRSPEQSAKQPTGIKQTRLAIV